MDALNEGKANLIFENPDKFLLEHRPENREYWYSSNVWGKQLFEDGTRWSYFDLGGGLKFPTDLSVEKILCIIKNEQHTYSSNPFKFSSIWILFSKERDCKLLTLEDVDILLPHNKSNLMISKSYLVNMHFTSAIVDHYSKEINKLLSEENVFASFKCNAILSQISCLPSGGKVTLFVIGDEQYESWMIRRNIERYDVLIQSPELKEVLYELQNMKEMFKKSEDNIKNNIIRYIQLKEEDAKSIVEAINFHVAGINSAFVISDKLSSGVTNTWLVDAANNIKESQVSVASLVQCNNLLIAENANVCNKYEKLKMIMKKYGDISSKEQLSVIKEDFLSQSNEQLRFKLISLMYHMEELQVKLHKSEEKNSSLSEQLLKIKFEKEQQNWKLYHDISNHDIENALLKKEIAEKDNTIKQALYSGRILFEDIRSIQNLLQSMGKDISFCHYDTLNNTDVLSEVMNTLRNCFNDFCQTFLTEHNKTESSERFLRQIKTEFTNVTNEFTQLNKEVCDLKEKLTLLNSENVQLFNNVSELSSENSLLLEQLSRSNARNTLLIEQLNTLWKQLSVDEGKKEETMLRSENFDICCFEKSASALKNEVDELLHAKHELLGRVHGAETKIKKLQYDLQHKELLLNKIIQNYESYVVLLKKESDEKEAELRGNSQILQKFVTGVQMEHAAFAEQIESLKKENFCLLHQQSDCKNEIEKLDGEGKVVKETVKEDLSFHLNDEKNESTGMKQKLEQICHIQEIFCEEEINFEAEIQKLIENECNEALIAEMDVCLDEKENLIKALQAQGNSDRNEIEQIRECASRWKKKLKICKMLLKEYKENKKEMTFRHSQFYQTLNNAIEINKSKCEALSDECHQKTVEIVKLAKELKISERRCENLKKQFNADLKENEKELCVAKKRVSDYEKHVSILDKELERQVKLVKETIDKGATEKKDLRDKITANTNEITCLTSKLSEKEKEIADLKEMYKNYDDKYLAAKKTISEWKLKYNEAERALLESKSVIKSLENEKRKIEDMLISYNKTTSDLIEEQRKVNKLENESQLLETLKKDLEKKLKEKEDLLQNSYNDLQSLKEELATMKILFQKNSQNVFLLESKHSQEKMNLEHALNKRCEENKITENAYKILFNEKAELLKEHDGLCDKLINAIHMLMENKLLQDRMEGQIKELTDIVSQLRRKKVCIEVMEDD